MKDRHWRSPYVLGRKVVWGTSLDSAERRAAWNDAPTADIGLYLDDRWETEARAQDVRFVAWPKLEAPGNTHELTEHLEAILAGLERGQTVEIACFGGHGRTGTAFACLDVLLGTDASAAVVRVRDQYCPYAIGTLELEAFVTEFARWVGARTRFRA